MPPIPFLEDLSALDWLAVAAGLLIVPMVFLISRVFVARRTARETALDEKLSDPFAFRSPADRRDAPRRRGNPIPVWVSDSEAKVEPVRGWVVDRSARGLGLELEEEGEVDVGIVLSIKPSSAPNAPWVRIEVRNRQKTGATWRLGCRFVKPPATDVLLHFG